METEQEKPVTFLAWVFTALTLVSVGVWVAVVLVITHEIAQSAKARISERRTKSD